MAGIVAMLALASAAAGCGGSGEGERPEEEAAAPEQAIVEIGETRAALDAALETYRKGDHQAAARQVGDAYLKHFEEVEGPLEARDEELNEELEQAISGELRDRMKADADVAEIERIVKDLRAGLSQAEAQLR